MTRKRHEIRASSGNAPDISFALWRFYVSAKANIACVKLLDTVQKHYGETRGGALSPVQGLYGATKKGLLRRDNKGQNRFAPNFS